MAQVRGKPAAGASIRYFADRLGNPDVPSVFDFGEARADDQGRFVLERVIPGDIRVTQGFGDGANFKAWPSGTLLEVRPGETAGAEFVDKGRPVVARIVPPAGFDAKADYTIYSQCSVQNDRSLPSIPKGEIAKNGEPATTSFKRWWASAEGHEYRRKRYIGAVTLRADGTIRAENVPPGDYRLQLTYSAHRIHGLGGSSQRIAYATKKFTIPEIPGGRSDEPFDLGVIRPELKKTSDAGEPAP